MVAKGTSRTIVNQFFASEVKNLESATRTTVRNVAREHKRLLIKQLKTNFTEGVHPISQLQGTFFKAVKIYDLETNPSKGGPISYVRMGVPFMHVFETPQSIVSRRKNLIILLPTGKALGFQRITKTNPWNRVWEAHKKHFKLARGRGGTVVLYEREGKKPIPIYKIQKSVQSTKRLDFYGAGEQAARGMDEQIKSLMEGYFNV